jgi:hypothetical protein
VPNTEEVRTEESATLGKEVRTEESATLGKEVSTEESVALGKEVRAEESAAVVAAAAAAEAVSVFVCLGRPRLLGCVGLTVAAAATAAAAAAEAVTEVGESMRRTGDRRRIQGCVCQMIELKAACRQQTAGQQAR